MGDGTGGNQGTFKQTAIGLLALAGLWNAVYWLWPVHREAPVVMASTAETADAGEDEAEATESVGLADAASLEPVVPEVPADPEPIIVDPIVHDLGELGVLPPRFHLYTTTASDRNLGDIASRYYGDKSKAPIIAQANPFKDPSRLAPDQVWRVPVDPDNIQGVLVDGEGNPAEAPPAEPPPAGYTEYLVQKGDTMGGISRMHYETTRYAEFIYAFNRERLGLKSIRGIRAGQVLHIPERPE
ncbi:MAG: LysM peptidoglycan-binding domain-containing protein [Phycisphaerales bacterium]|jgi:nucleoid-associated protein YgaU